MVKVITYGTYGLLYQGYINLLRRAKELGDYLLTDYSSMFIDFDITGKPTGFVMDVIDEYRNTRGFYFDDLESVLPGPIIQDYDNLVSFIKDPVRKPAGIVLNDFNDNRSSERILKSIGVL